MSVVPYFDLFSLGSEFWSHEGEFMAVVVQASWWPWWCAAGLALAGLLIGFMLLRGRDARRMNVMLQAEIEARAKVEQKLRETEERNKLQAVAVETMNDGLLIVDARLKDLPIVYANPQFSSMTGYSEAEIIGSNCRFLQGEETSIDTVRKIRDAIIAELPFEGELQNYRKDGTSFWNNLRIVPIHDKVGTMTHFVGIQTDITEQKRATERQLRDRRELAHASRVATMGGLTSAIAHELNQPLAAIGANAQAARRFMAGPEPNLEELSEILEDIISDNQRAADVIRRMRNLLKKRVGEDEILDMNRLIKSVETLVHSDAILRKISVELELDLSIAPVRAGRIEIQQVLLNLVVNGFDSMAETPSNNKRLVIRTEATDMDCVQVSVIDQGCGIEDADLAFEPFHTTKSEGLGMGLSINKTIVQSYGGRIWAEKNTREGSSFYFSLPVDHS